MQEQHYSGSKIESIIVEIDDDDFERGKYLLEGVGCTFTRGNLTGTAVIGFPEGSKETSALGVSTGFKHVSEVLLPLGKVKIYRIVQLGTGETGVTFGVVKNGA